AATQPGAAQPAIPCLEHGPGTDADVPQFLEMGCRRDRLGFGAGKRLQLHRAADGFLAQALGPGEVGHEVSDHAGQVDRERAAALPELQRAEARLQQTLEEGLSASFKHIVSCYQLASLDMAPFPHLSTHLTVAVTSPGRSLEWYHNTPRDYKNCSALPARQFHASGRSTIPRSINASPVQATNSHKGWLQSHEVNGAA